MKLSILHKRKIIENYEETIDDFSNDGTIGMSKNNDTPVGTAINNYSGTQTKLADRVGVDKSEISRFKSGERKPRLDTLKKLKKSVGPSVLTAFGL